MKVGSLHPSKRAAEEFAKGLRQKGAEEVKISKRTSAGYLVTSEVHGVTEEEIEAGIKSSLPESTERYPYETTTEPVSARVAVYEIANTTPQKTKEDIIRIAREELQRANLGRVQIRVSSYQGRDPEAPYADATFFRRRGRTYINIHPIHQYYSDDYTREVVQHEIEHILRGGI